MNTYVLLPGNSLNGSIFDTLIPLLPEGDVHIVELSGHGNFHDPSQSLTEQWGFPAAGRKLADWLVEKDLWDVVLIGHSFGGQVCAHALGHGIGNRVRLLISTGAPPLTFPPDVTGFRQRPELPLFFTPDLSDDDIEALASVSSTEHADVLAEMIRATPSDFRAAAAQIVADQSWEDEYRTFQTRPCPVAFVAALDDPFINSGYIRDKASELGYPYIGIPSASHVPMLDDVEAYAEAINSLLLQVPAKQSDKAEEEAIA